MNGSDSHSLRYRLSYLGVEAGTPPSQFVVREALLARLVLLKSSLFRALCDEFQDAMQARAFLKTVAQETGRPVFLNTEPVDDWVTETVFFGPVGMTQDEAEDWAEKLQSALIDTGLLDRRHSGSASTPEDV